MSAEDIHGYWRATGLWRAEIVQVLAASQTVGLAVLDDQLRYQAVNPAIAGTNRVPVEAHIGASVRDILKDASAKFEPLLTHVLRTAEPLHNVEISAQLPTRSGVAVWCSTYFPIKDERGRVAQLGAIVVETTSQHRLAQAQRGLRRAAFLLANEGHREPAAVASELQGFKAMGEEFLQPLDRIAVKTSPSELTGRKLEILQLLADGRSNKEVAGILGLSVRTVEAHRRRIMNTLDISSFADLIRYAIRTGVIEP